MPVETSTGPEVSSGFGARESADETRQAQQGIVNDAPVDTNFNAVLARVQGGVMAQMSINAQTNADLRDKLFGHAAGQLVQPK